MDLSALLLEKMKLHSNRPAFITPAREWSFREITGLADRMVPSLAAAGLREGEIVGLALPNSAAFVAGLLALFRLRAVVALVPPGYTPGEWRQILDGIPTLSILTSTETAHRLREEPTGNLAWTEIAMETDGPAVIWGTGRLTDMMSGDSRGGTATLIKFTSGSTAAPKAIALSTANLLAEVENVTRTLEISPGTTLYAPVPLYHSYGFDVGVLPFLLAGARLVTDERFIPRRALRTLVPGGIDIYLGVPAQYRFLMEASAGTVVSLRHIRYCLSCTAPLSPRAISDFSAQFATPICQHYGSSEAGAVTNHLPSEVLNRPGSVGRPLSGVEVLILDEAGNPLPPGSEGEVVARSGAVAQGYVLGGPPGTSPFRNGGFSMGDRGVLDPDGFLEIRGRLDDLINVGGLKVSPLEVSRALEEFPGIKEALAYAVWESEQGQIVEAMVAATPEIMENDVLAFLRERLADYKVPRRIHIRAELPRGATGKVQVPRSRETAEDDQQGKGLAG